MSRAKSSPRSTSGRAGRATSDTNGAVMSARSALVWIVVVVGVLLWALRDLVLLVGYSVLLAYALLPVVAAIERPIGRRRGFKLPRGVAAAGVMLGLVAVVGWLIALAVPRLAVQAARFASSAPAVLAGVLQEARTFGAMHGMSAWLDPVLEAVRVYVSGTLRDLGGTLATWSGRALGGLGQVLGLALVPLLAFYLLEDSKAVQVSALRFVPESAHFVIARLGGAVDRALRSYVRGQAIVCLVMGAVTGAALALLGSPVALLLGLLVGFAELVPYLGFLVAASAIALAGLSVSPLHALAGITAYVIINWIVGAFVTPRVMGRYLKMHPFVVTVSVLAGIQLVGPAGALLALPGAAMLQAVVGELAATRTGEAALIPPAPPSRGGPATDWPGGGHGHE